jgi:hypothetical protein
MSIRKTITLVGLTLAVAALIPASGLAKAGGTERPVNGSGSGIVSINVGTGAVTADASGVATHLGDYTTHIDARIVKLNPDGTVVVQGTQTVVADNGDHLTGPVTITGPAPTTSVHPSTAVMTVTGGTGRFADANGTLIVNNVATPFSFDGVTLLEKIDAAITGNLSY